MESTIKLLSGKTLRSSEMPFYTPTYRKHGLLRKRSQFLLLTKFPSWRIPTPKEQKETLNTSGSGHDSIIIYIELGCSSSVGKTTQSKNKGTAKQKSRLQPTSRTGYLAEDDSFYQPFYPSDLSDW